MSEEAVRLTVTIALQAPLLLGDRRPVGQPLGLDYLPGARLRGAAAAALLATGVCPPAHREGPAHVGPADCPLPRLFEGSTAARFLDAFPAGAAELLPVTAASCADLPGFASSQAGHGVFDTLIDRACWETLSPAGLLYQPRCPHADCGAPVAAYAGTYGVRAVGGRPSYVRRELPRRRQAGAAVDASGAAVSVYTAPVVGEAQADPLAARATPRPVELQAEVVVPAAADAPLLRDALSGITHLGGGVSRGLGAVEVAVAEGTTHEPVAARLERFRAAFAVRRGQYAKLAPQSAAALEGSYFSLDLRADAILRRDDWLPTVVPDADVLRAATGVHDPTLTLVRAYARPEWRGGWHVAWGLPRPVELAARRGSCYLYRTADLGIWADALAALEARGLGARTAEGFGDVRVCDAFHLVLREQAV